MFAIFCTLGVRTAFFQFWRWREVELLKVPMLRGDVVEDVEALSPDEEVKVSVRFCASVASGPDLSRRIVLIRRPTPHLK